ncbi:hypothetical protein HY572_05035 [Candidatus Micrarchaeota archaeon]|nr:hypothetical protein [Candidatus Micrarchaeota archaeon]
MAEESDFVRRAKKAHGLTSQSPPGFPDLRLARIAAAHHKPEASVEPRTLQEGTLAGMKEALDSVRHRKMVPHWRDELKKAGFDSAHNEALAEFLAHASHRGNSAAAKNLLYALMRLETLEAWEDHLQFLEGMASDRDFVRAVMDHVKTQNWPDYTDSETPDGRVREHLGDFKNALERLRMPPKWRPEKKASRRRGS